MKFKFFLGTLSFFLTQMAGAVPSLYSDVFNRNLRNNTNSNVVADSVETSRFYVLPPSRSFAEVRNLHTATANVGFCKEIANIQKYNLDTLELINSLKNKSAQEREQLESYKLKISQAETELAKHLAANNMVEYEKYKNYIYFLKNNVDEIENNNRKIQSSLAQLYSDFLKMYDAHAQREGGRVAIDYKSQWSENVQRLRQDNPNLSFERIQTKNAKIRADAFSRKQLVAGGAILRFEISGQGTYDTGALELESFPESFTGNAVLNLLSVCPMLHPDWFGLEADDMQKMSYGLIASYEYPSEFKYELTVTYNMYKMYELIKSQGTNGGFFSSRSWSTQDEDNYFRDSFKAVWNVNDDRNLFSEEKKLNIVADIRRQMMNRLANNLVMGDPAIGQNLQLPTPPTGAVVLSNSLTKICPFSIYCQGASLILNTVQAIVGSSRVDQDFKQTMNVDMTDYYRSNQIVMQPALITYQ